MSGIWVERVNAQTDEEMAESRVEQMADELGIRVSWSEGMGSETYRPDFSTYEKKLYVPNGMEQGCVEYLNEWGITARIAK